MRKKDSFSATGRKGQYTALMLLESRANAHTNVASPERNKTLAGIADRSHYFSTSNP